MASWWENNTAQLCTVKFRCVEVCLSGDSVDEVQTLSVACCCGWSITVVCLMVWIQHHCRHCGQIFCVDCLGKTVSSGPHRRPTRVCDVCHTILVRDATPYFCSTDTLHTPEWCWLHLLPLFWVFTASCYLCSIATNDPTQSYGVSVYSVTAADDIVGFVSRTVGRFMWFYTFYIVFVNLVKICIFR